MSHKFQNTNLENLGVVTGELPVPIYNDVMEEINEFKKGFISDESRKIKLVSFIEGTYLLKKSYSILRPYLLEMSEEYCRNWGYNTNSERELENVWVNMQKKYEMNPLHCHNGMLSFVCWMDIPYSIEEEWNQPNVKASNFPKLGSTFVFHYLNILGEMCTREFAVEKGWERRIIMFPSALWHQVYPFQTSDDLRISIAGNIIPKNDNQNYKLKNQ